jgi:hypothetical protein
VIDLAGAARLRRVSMPRHPIVATIAAALGTLLCLPAAAQKPSPEEQKRTLDAAREIAIHYTSRLPDFICTEQVQRSEGNGASNRIDRLTVQLSYFQQKEKYKLVAMNGSPAKQALETLNDGLITAGEFGSQQLGVFDPQSAADFQWKQATTLRKRAVSVYSYRIVRANSHYLVGERGEDGKMVAAPAGYTGEVFLDNNTGRVLRLTASAGDIPKESGILRSSVEVDYDFIDVAGQSYLLPSHSESFMEHLYRKLSNTVTFVDYRKFEADSTISFK